MAEERYPIYWESDSPECCIEQLSADDHPHTLIIGLLENRRGFDFHSSSTPAEAAAYLDEWRYRIDSRKPVARYIWARQNAEEAQAEKFSDRLKQLLQDELHRIQRNLNMHKDHRELQGALFCNRELQTCMNDCRLIGMTDAEIADARVGGHLPF